MNRLKIEAIIVISLLALTATIYLLQRYSWHHSLTIDKDVNFPIQAVSDKGSTSSLTIIDNKLVLDCEIIATDHAWPFCEIAIQLHRKEQPFESAGYDLSSFENVTIYADYKNRAPLSIRFQLRHFNKIYSNKNDSNSMKYNILEYFNLEESTAITIPLDALQVATWWLVEQKIPIQYTAPEFGNIMVIALTTGNNISPGKYQIILEKIVFTGKKFSNEQVYIAIIFLWISAAQALFLYHFALSKYKLSKAHRKTIELKRLNKLLNVQTQELKDQSERDPLTGALNRTGIKSLFTNQVPMLSIAFIDIDNFKHINDIYGHGVGDEVLKQFAALLSENCRDTDFLARWGGEEFLLICPNTNLEQIHFLAEEIRALIEDFPWSNNIRLTSSFGIAQRGRESIADFIDRADKALYSAKAQGRNQVVVSVSVIKKK
ncbi:MAG: GGDEF domain-containing protein [Colwellia sp.]|nr:GGDEF domain-containing protein [Colwellia sp.]